jgi:hypothetical protein
MAGKVHSLHMEVKSAVWIGSADLARAAVQTI